MTEKNEPPRPVMTRAELTERMMRLPVGVTLYRLLDIRPDEEMYDKMWLDDILTTVRAKNLLLRNQTRTLHELLSMRYPEFSRLHNNGVPCIFQILEDVQKAVGRG